jgi:hypothetical protein
MLTTGTVIAIVLIQAVVTIVCVVSTAIITIKRKSKDLDD